MSKPVTWRPPARFADYDIIRPLGRGGMGQVYLAHDRTLERPVAIKFLLDDGGAVARERFAIEARAAARLQHPNVAAVHQVGELHGQPYIVAELVRGTSLDRSETPLPWRRALEIGLAVARGLAAAHRRGILHRDIKPGNVILAEDGEVKLVDFGLAKFVGGDGAAPPGSRTGGRDHDGATPGGADPGADTLRPGDDTLEPLDAGDDGVTASSWSYAPHGSGATSPPLTADGAVVGTPYYIAPELWAGRGATPASDVYSVGALLYELVTGAPPHRDIPWKELAAHAGELGAPAVSAADVDRSFAAVVERALATEPAERFASAAELRDALLEIEARPDDAPIPAGNPYRGLLPFEAEHRTLFFGRRSDLRAVLERLRADSFALVAGESGVGKSSLCRAAVLPAIARGALGGGRAWSAVTVVPGRRPLTSLAAAVAPLLDSDEDALARELSQDPDALRRRLVAYAGRDRGAVVFVDQLEELITIAAGDQAAVVACALGALAERVPGVRLVAAVRGDHLTRLAELPGLGACLAPALYVLRPLDEDGLREAIVTPARTTGVEIASDAVDRLVADAVSLPLLQVALAELWDARTGNVITAAAVDAVGGAAGALARRADSVLAALPAAVRTAARDALLRLVTTAGTSAQRPPGELAADTDNGRHALDALVGGRLVVASTGEGGEPAYRLAHEALVTQWSTLAGWLEERREGRVIAERLAGRAAEWDSAGRPRDALLSGRQLADARRVALPALSAIERAYLGASRRHARRTRWLRAAAVALVVLAMFGVYAGVRAHDARELDRRVATRTGEAETALADARAARADYDRLRDRALREMFRGDGDAGEATWKEARAAAARADAALARGGQALEQALLLAPDRASVRRVLADALLERADFAAQRRDHARAREHLGRVALYDDGSRVNAWNAPVPVALTSSARGGDVRIERVVAGDGGAFARDPVARGQLPLELALPPGSYVAEIEHPGAADTTVPFVVERGAPETVEVALVAAGAVPDGFVYVPGGELSFGSAADEGLRVFHETVPIHTRRVEGFVIARHETTFADWIGYLETLDEAERARRTPNVEGLRGRQELTLREDGRWQLTLVPADRAYTAAWGEPIRYLERSRRAEQDWRKFPVGGISFDDIVAYTSWLDATGRVPGARPCREDEWVRAARGADERLYPHGDALAPDDANIDETYGRRDLAYGPDEVGSHPRSASVFGVDDLTGNVFELLASSLDEGKFVVRGGGYYFDRTSAKIENRWAAVQSTRDPVMGIRVCADAPAPLGPAGPP